MTTQIKGPSLPLPVQGPPAGFDYDRGLPAQSTQPSDTTAFDTGLNERDSFRGQQRCVVCGSGISLDHCHIIPQQWRTLKERAYVPKNSKRKAQHEPRDGAIMCKNHHSQFDEYLYFIRFHKETQKYYLINFSGREELAMHHGKAVALDFAHQRAPYPAVFLIHEIRTRGFWPWQEHTVDISANTYQDWVVRGGYLNEGGHLSPNAPEPAPLPAPYGDASSLGGQSGLGQVSGRKVTLEPPEAIFAQTLAFQQTMPTWRAALLENESWSGTATDNIQKYLALTERS
ncbi:hypothetical protein AURDEDRAFT_53357 [Auricularia subglabra TFB-10046 SS5]|nr:hypothetical protein AURDEDRAFT_53357 [Auricularia subglabra TFB-10046 SS5]